MHIKPELPTWAFFFSPVFSKGDAAIAARKGSVDRKTEKSQAALRLTPQMQAERLF